MAARALGRHNGLAGRRRAGAPSSMKLIVNGDDFGASSGVNLGIVEAHKRGILTSTSLMVEAPASEEAARVGSKQRDLGVGLHAVLDTQEPAPLQALERQLEGFVELIGRLPTHI